MNIQQMDGNGLFYHNRHLERFALVKFSKFHIITSYSMRLVCLQQISIALNGTQMH